MNSRHKFLLQYSALAAAFLYQKDSIAQVVYTNVEPDIALDTLFSQYDLDMNDDGIFDFQFENWLKNVTFYDYYGEPSGSLDCFLQWAGGYFNLNNQIIGISNSVYTSSSPSIAVYYYPFALEIGDIISSNKDWQSWYWQRMAFKGYIDNNFDNIATNGGYWWPGADEKFLGVRFADTEDQVHYGWIRCSIIDSAEGLIIHDFAYETTPDYPILAGSLTSYVGLEESNTTQIQLYAFNGTISIKNAPLNAQLLLTDLSGKIVINQTLHAGDQSYGLALPAGIYIAQIQFESANILVKKIAL